MIKYFTMRTLVLRYDGKDNHTGTQKQSGPSEMRGPETDQNRAPSLTSVRLESTTYLTYSAQKQIVSKQQEKKYQQYAYENALYKQLDNHSDCNPEQCIANQSSHGDTFYPFILSYAAGSVLECLLFS